MRMHASLMTSVALTTEVAALKQDLERSEKELDLAKRQLEENKGKQYLVYRYVYIKEDAIAE